MVAALNDPAPLFSVIIPVHNDEQYLADCLDSILLQRFTSFEVLLVDDESNDGSWNICQDYTIKDSRIRCFKQPWGGVSKARNHGLGQARGEWIVFVDADDRVLPDAFSIYHEVISSSEADIVKCGYVKNQGGVRTGCIIPERQIISNGDTASMLKATEESGYCGFLWNSAFRRSIIGDIRFDEDISWLEDHVFSRRCFKNSRTLVLENRASYEYFIRDRTSLSIVKNPFMMMEAAYREYRSRINLLHGEAYRDYEAKERLVYGRILKASRLAKNLPFSQKTGFHKKKRETLGRIPGGKMRYLRTIGELILHRIHIHGLFNFNHRTSLL